MKYIDEYIEMVETESEHLICNEQKKLVDMIKRVLEEEKDNILLDEVKAEKYLSYQKYFPFELFAWEKYRTS